MQTCSDNQVINVTKPFLPPLEDLIPLLEEIWASGVLSNNGPFHSELERALSDRLDLSHLSLFCNATIALITAQQALDIQGEVITTPYSFVATSHALRWMQNEPVFVDIEPDSLCIDPMRIEAAITPKTRAIMPLHCYGNTCDTVAIAAIAKKYGLKVIYDACHSFGVEDSGGPVLRHGDISVVSFHATKVFNTFEGGVLVAPDSETKTKIDNLKNFGFVNETTVIESGLNGKMSEFNAAVGLLQLQHIEEIFDKRGRWDALYRELLAPLNGVTCVAPVRQIKRNFAYFPILISAESDVSRDEVYETLKRHGIFARRYFYPLISSFPMYNSHPSASISNLPVANDISQRVLCLPLYPDLEESDVCRICGVIQGALQ